MLTLTRYTNESLMINDDVKITVLAINNYQVKFGIEAPKNIPIHRQEIYKRIQAEKGLMS